MNGQGQPPSGYKLPDGARTREKLASEFWSPKVVGEVLVGRVASWENRQFQGKDRVNFELAPALLYEKGKAPQGFGSIRVPYNSWLRRIISHGEVGGVFALVYTGRQDTPAGKMVTYKVAEYPNEDAFHAECDKVAPGLWTPAGEGTSTASPEVVNDDDLPF